MDVLVILAYICGGTLVGLALGILAMSSVLQYGDWKLRRTLRDRDIHD